MDVDTFNRTFGHTSRGLGGAVFDGDPNHPKHSALVKACGDFLQAQPGVLVWATYTGRPTGKGVCGTPGIPDLCGWVTRSYHIGLRDGGEGSEITGISRSLRPVARILCVECKVGKDKLREAQEEFRKLAEAAGVLYYVARWDGVDPDHAADDLKKQWGATQED
jgi:hypothetical protein